MAKQTNPRSNPIVQVLIWGAILWLLYRFQPGPHADPYHLMFWWLGAILMVSHSATLALNLPKWFSELMKYARALGEDHTKGSAGWLTEKEARRAGLHRRRKGSRFAGILHSVVLWLWTETHHLILGPAGSQKTTAAILNILMGCSESALISDVKGELWETTRKHRQRRFEHRCVKIDPKDAENSVKINPLDYITTAVENNDPAALSRAKGMVMQLHPDPEGGAGQNKVFYDGARLLIVTVIFAVVVVMPPQHRNLAMVYRAINDLDILHSLLEAAMKSPALRGEIANMASSQHASAFGDAGTAKTFEQFRIGAVQSLDSFGPGNYLAPITCETTFSFSELKAKPTSLYITIDYANSSVLGKFSGLLQWLAAEELVAVGNNKPVLFVLDEFCNAPLYSLPKILTLLRSYGIKCILVTQDLDDITRVYSKHALESVLSETHIKQFLGGIRAQGTLEYLSRYLGEYTETTVSQSLGSDGIQESLSRTNRRLLSEDEIRCLPDSAQIILYGNLKPILATKVQVFAIAPWRRKMAANSLYGGKRKLSAVEAKIGWFRSHTTAWGRKRYRQMLQDAQKKNTAWRSAIWSRMLNPISALSALLMAGSLALCFQIAGLPNLRWEYAQSRSAQHSPETYAWCRYVGPTSPGTISDEDCPLILWRKTW